MSACDCGHDGMPPNWHMTPCPIKSAYFDGLRVGQSQGRAEGLAEMEHRREDPMSGAVLVAACENELINLCISTRPTRCPGRLHYHWGQIEAACDRCGARCGIAVADWIEVVPRQE
jgi:hypothetical protein